jgi:hypothetical protein
MKPTTYRQQLLVLAGMLIAAATFSFLQPSFGPLIIGLNILFFIEITRVRYPQNTLSVTLMLISVLVVFWGWISPNIHPFSGIFALTLVFLWFAHCLQLKPITKISFPRLSSIMVLLLSIFVYIQSESQLISALLRGYDNSAHLPALSQVFRHGGFIYSGNLPPNFTFSNFVNGYPPLQQSTWAFIMSLSNIQILGGYEIIRYFSFFFFGTGILAVALILENWRSIDLVKSKNLFRPGITFIVFLLLSFSSANFILWQGFPPFLWACCIIIATMNLIETQPNGVLRILLVLTGLTLVNYSYPLISPVLVLVLLFELVKFSKTDLIFIKAHIWKVAITGLIGFGSNIPIVIKTLQIKQYFDDDGGIQPVDSFVLYLTLGVILITLLLFKSPFTKTPIHVVGFFSSVVTFSVFALISKVDKGYVSYYPAKAGYLALVLGFTSLGAVQIRPPKLLKLQLQKTVQVFVLIASVGVLMISVNRTLDNQYEPGSTHKILNDYIDGDPNPATMCFQKAMNLTADLNSNESNQQILFLQDDLSTRWINGVRGRLIDATYSLSITAGQGQTLPEILTWWTIQFPGVELVVLAPEMPSGVEKWQHIIEHRPFTCS